MLKMYHWSTKSEKEAWVCSGYDLMDINNLQESVNKVMRALAVKKEATIPPDVRMFVLNKLLPYTEPVSPIVATEVPIEQVVTDEVSTDENNL